MAHAAVHGPRASRASRRRLNVGGAAVGLIAALLLASCSGGETKSAATPPAKVTAPKTEASLTTITLTDEAVRRLGIETVAIEQKGITRTRTVGGEVMPAGGAQTTVTAPFAGTLEAGSACRCARHDGRQGHDHSSASSRSRPPNATRGSRPSGSPRG